MSEVITTSNQIGSIVRKQRAQLGITQAQLAEAAHVSRRTVILLEEGEAVNIGAGKLIGILDELGLSLSLGKAQKKRN